jgi:hypothetical protein
MDHLRWRGADGGHHVSGCHVSSLATLDEIGSVVFEYCVSGLSWAVLRHCDREAHILYCDYRGC